MRSVLIFVFALFAAIDGFAATDAGAIAKLVLNADAVSLGEPLTAALADPQPLVRATAARIAAVRDVKPLIAPLREAIARETDSSAAREEICALALIGSTDDVAFAAAASAKWPAGVDDALALAIARRGGTEALSLYESLLRERPIGTREEFFRTMLWGREALIPLTGSRLIARSDAPGWSALLSTLCDAAVAMPAGILTAALTSPAEPMRYHSLHYLVHGYAPDPSKLPAELNDVVKRRAEASSNREDFARVLIARMLGAERQDDPRWTEWLESAEAGELLGRDDRVLQYLTDAEYAVLHNRCRTDADCSLPEKRIPPLKIPMQEVAPPAFNLPDVLPAGLVHDIVRETKCRDEWLGVLTATVDTAGRVQSAPIDIDTAANCKAALGEILRLSFATNTSLRSPVTGPVIVVKGRGDEPCLDWEVPEKVNSARLVRIGGPVKMPVLKRRVEPQFPDVARYQMHDAGGRDAVIILQAVISTTGCVRSLRFLAQTPLPALNGAAAMALSKWTFVPAYLNGQPVDVLFNLTIHYKLN